MEGIVALWGRVSAAPALDPPLRFSSTPGPLTKAPATNLSQGQTLNNLIASHNAQMGSSSRITA